MKILIFKLFFGLIVLIKMSFSINNDSIINLVKNLKDYSFEGTWNAIEIMNSSYNGINNKYFKNQKKGKFSIYFTYEESHSKFNFDILFFIHEDFYNENYLTFLTSYTLEYDKLNLTDELNFNKKTLLSNGVDLFISTNKQKNSIFHHNSLFISNNKNNILIDYFDFTINLISKIKTINGKLEINNLNIAINFTTQFVAINFQEEYNYQLNTFSFFFIMIVSFQIYYIFKFFSSLQNLNSISYYFLLSNFYFSIGFLNFFLYLSALYIFNNNFQITDKLKILLIFLSNNSDGKSLIITIFGFEYLIMCLIYFTLLLKRYRSTKDCINYVRNLGNIERQELLIKNYILKQVCTWKLIPLSFFFTFFFFEMCLYKYLMLIAIIFLYLLQIIFLLIKRPNNNDKNSIVFCTLISLDKIIFILYFRGSGYLLNAKPDDKFILIIIIIYLISMCLIWIITFFKIHIILNINNNGYNYFQCEENIKKILKEHLDKNEIKTLICSICLENIFIINKNDDTNNKNEISNINNNTMNLNNTTLTDNKIEVIENESKLKKNKYKKKFIQKIKDFFKILKEKIKNIFIKYNKTKLMITPCHHVFHTICLQNWMNVKLICPLCNNELPDFYN